MSYYFFFSYKRSADTRYLEGFFNDLSKEVAGQLELKDHTKVGFFDERDIELGVNWEPAIARALQESAVLVCAYTPQYFKSEYCGKEWQVFQMRRERYKELAKLAGDQKADLPPVIKPILWQNFAADPGAAVSAIQYVHGDLQKILDNNELRSVTKRNKAHEDIYGRYIEKLASQIIDASHYKLPSLDNLPDLSKVPSAFARQQQSAVAQVQPQLPGAAAPTKHVRFIFVVGDPSKFAGQRQIDAYGERASHWKPFYPQKTDRIGRLLQHFVSSEEMDFDSDIVEFDQDLVTVVERAYNDRKIVVLLVDGWTVSWDNDCRDILWRFDHEHKPFYNCTVLVPWNESDLEIQDQRHQIIQNVRDTFDSRANLWKNEMFYRDSITSLDDLLNALRDALNSIRGELHRRVTVGKPVPGGIGKPIVSNQTYES